MLSILCSANAGRFIHVFPYSPREGTPAARMPQLAGNLVKARADSLRKLGFITPLTHNFCESCNRVRVTCTGQLYMCLGQDDNADLRAALRDGGEPALDGAIAEAIGRKPKGHDFIIDRRNTGPAVSRHMSVTGG